jgi:hypothetical protein
LLLHNFFTIVVRLSIWIGWILQNGIQLVEQFLVLLVKVLVSCFLTVLESCGGSVGIRALILFTLWIGVRIGLHVECDVCVGIIGGHAVNILYTFDGGTRLLEVDDGRKLERVGGLCSITCCLLGEQPSMDLIVVWLDPHG